MIRVRKLPSGVTVATDRMQGVRSCAIGVWLMVGSQHETPEEAGLAHFIEHMLFKGTDKYDALELADELNRVGGNVNASTSQENLCLHAQCVDEKAPRVLDLLSQMLLDSIYDVAEIQRERNVILEEYKMYEDSPDDLIVDLFFKNLWPGSPLGRPVIGTPSSIRKFSAPRIHRFLSREFRPNRLLIVVAGNFEPRAVSRVVDRHFSEIRLPRAGRPTRAIAPLKCPVRRTLDRRSIEQVHFCLGTGGPRRPSPDRFPFGLMNIVLGGGMSSRLIKEVREKRGLAYSISSFTQPFQTAGSLAVAGSTSAESLDEVLRLTLEEMRRICDEPVSEEELGLARDQVLDSLLMSVESTYSRMMRLADHLMVYGRPIPYDEIARRILAVTPADMRRVARKYFRGQSLAGAFIGPPGTKIRALGNGVL